MYNKVTVGFVVQVFDDNGNPVRQEFVAGDDVTYETPQGKILDDGDVPNEQYFPFDMVQPNG